ncbi:MAG: hypothetical protein GEV06_13065 [Luteitalea sp.]|nr:hypothetical protein [Luteitalea sp.]
MTCSSPTITQKRKGTPRSGRSDGRIASVPPCVAVLTMYHRLQEAVSATRPREKTRSGPLLSGLALAPVSHILRAWRTGHAHAGYWNGAPDLAVEVLSPEDGPGKVQRKIAAWLAHGTRVVCVVDPNVRTLTVHRPNWTPNVLTRRTRSATRTCCLDFRCVREIFAEM